MKGAREVTDCYCEIWKPCSAHGSKRQCVWSEFQGKTVFTSRQRACSESDTRITAQTATESEGSHVIWHNPDQFKPPPILYNLFTHDIFLSSKCGTVQSEQTEPTSFSRKLVNMATQPTRHTILKFLSFSSKFLFKVAIFQEFFSQNYVYTERSHWKFQSSEIPYRVCC